LSLSRLAKSDSDASLSGQDFLFAFVAHLLIITIIAMITWWQGSHAPEPPLKRIEVSMISAQALKKLQHPKSAKKVQAVKKKSPPKPKQVVKPVAKLKPAKVKPASSKIQDEPDFDPFAPIASNSDTPDKSRSKPKPDIADLMGKQLSTQEIDRYIAMMQAAVQRHWKVPGGISENTPDPVVEMVLLRNGHLQSLKILESSGNSAFDQTLISAIQAAEPFNIPLEQFESFRVNRIRFHPLK